MSGEEVALILGLDKLNSRKWLVQTSCFVTGDGILEGLDWVLNNTYSIKCCYYFQLDRFTDLHDN